MGELVTTHSQDLIFQPTETLATRVIVEQERREEFERKFIDIERRLRRSRFWSFSFGGATFASALAVAFVWFLASSQIARAEEARDTAIEQSKIAADAQNTAIANLEEEQDRSSRQSDDLRNLIEYQDIAYLYDDVENRYLYTLDRYETLLTSNGNRLPREVSDALVYDPELRDLLTEIKEQLRLDEEALTDKIDIVESFIETRKLEITRPECYPNKIFGSAAVRCE